MPPPKGFALRISRAIGSQPNCYSWCGFPFRCLENDSADHIHILKYFLRTCNRTAGTDSCCSARPPHNCFRRDSSRRQKYQSLRAQAGYSLFIWGKKRGKSQGTWSKRLKTGDTDTKPETKTRSSLGGSIRQNVLLHGQCMPGYLQGKKSDSGRKRTLMLTSFVTTRKYI